MPELRVSELPESSDTDGWSSESSRFVVSGALGVGASESSDNDDVVADGTVVDVLVVDVVLVDDVTATGAGSSTGTGFCQTERDVGAPMFGNSVSRTAYAVPAEPITAAAATTATKVRPDHERHAPERGPSVGPLSGVCTDLTGASARPSPCPLSSQLSLTSVTLPAEPGERHATLVVVPAAEVGGHRRRAPGSAGTVRLSSSVRRRDRSP